MKKALLAGAALGLVFSSPALADIVIATAGPMTGQYASFGAQMKAGAEMAVEEINAAGGVLGEQLKLEIGDDACDPKQAVAVANQFAGLGVQLVAGHFCSGSSIPASAVYAEEGIVMISPASTNPVFTDDRPGPGVFRMCGRDDQQGDVAGQFLVDNFPDKKVAFIHDKTAYGQGIAEFFKQEAEAKGMEVLGFEGTEEKANFDALLSPILAANPDVVYFGGMYGQAALLFKQAREKGYMGMFMSDDGFDSSDAAKIGGQSLLEGAGTFYSTVSGPAAVYPDTAKFIADFKAKYNADPQPFAAQSYDSMGICLKAIEAAAKAGNGKLPTRAEVAQAVRGLAEYKGITGTVTFNSIGDPVIAKYFVIQVGSADPAKWPENPIVQTLDIAPPAP